MPGLSRPKDGCFRPPMSRASTSVLLECCAQRHGRAWPDHPACASRPSCPRLSRASTSLLLQGRKTWMPGTRPGMTAKRQYANATHHPASAIQHSLMAGLVPAIQITGFTFQTANQTANQTPMRHHPYCLARPRVGPSSLCLPSKKRGMARQGAQPFFLMCPHPLSEIRGAARRATQTSLRSLGSFAASSLRRRAALFVAARENTERPPSASSWRAAPIGRQAEPRRRPGACLAGHARGRRIRSHPHDAS